MSEPRGLLHLDDAVELGHAWAQSIAEAHGIRVLLIKGPALHRHGLRDERTSSDIDVLVDPARFADLCDAVTEAGWVARPGSFVADRTSPHSTAFVKDGWPCDLDVHSRYPGFLADPAGAFEALWARHVRMSFAHQECDVPDRVGSMLILALHSLRGTTTQRRHTDELEQLARVSLTEDERADVAALALVTGSAATLETVLPRLGVRVEAPPDELGSKELREWRERVAAGSHGSYFWLLALRRAPVRERPLVLWHAFWLSAAELRITHPEIDGTRRSVLRARGRRWRHGITSAPAAVRAVIMHRRRRDEPDTR